MSNPQNPTVFYVQQQNEHGTWDTHGEGFLNEAACVARLRQLEAEDIFERAEPFELTDLLNMDTEEIEDLDKEETVRCILAADAGLVTAFVEEKFGPGGTFSYDELELVG